MHKEILTSKQVNMIPLVKLFSKDFYLVGGTAIALHIGHRRSIDFDLFTKEPFDNNRVKRVIMNKTKIQNVMRDEKGQYTIIVDGVHITFFQYPFTITADHLFERVINLPDVLTLAAMKAYALGRRAKWKDYVDLYFVIQKYHGISAIINKAHSIFGKEFNERLFREQLSYFKDINYSEEVLYMPGFEVKDKVVENGLREFSLQQ